MSWETTQHYDDFGGGQGRRLAALAESRVEGWVGSGGGVGYMLADEHMQRGDGAGALTQAWGSIYLRTCGRRNRRAAGGGRGDAPASPLAASSCSSPWWRTLLWVGGSGLEGGGLQGPDQRAEAGRRRRGGGVWR